MLTRIRQRQIPYDFTCMWHLKNKTNEQIQQKREVKRYKLPATKYMNHKDEM